MFINNIKFGFGRIPSPPDERVYSVRQLEQMFQDGVAIPVIWSNTEILNQGKTNHCVGFGIGGMLNCDDENHIEGIVTVVDAIDVVIPTAWKKRFSRIYS